MTPGITDSRYSGHPMVSAITRVDCIISLKNKDIDKILNYNLDDIITKRSCEKSIRICLLAVSHTVI